MTARPEPDTPDALARMPPERFVARWRDLVGEPPAILLASRAEMIRLLVQSVPSVRPNLVAPATARGRRPDGTDGAASKTW